ncbi:hypothetical protein ES707_20655 [subsurface metagenome]
MLFEDMVIRINYTVSSLDHLWSLQSIMRMQTPIPRWTTHAPHHVVQRLEVRLRIHEFRVVLANLYL